MTISRFDTNADGLEAYRIHSPREILSFLEEIRRQRQLIRMTFSEGRENVLTSLLKVDTEHQCLYVDAAPDAAQNRRVASSQQVGFETTLDKIRIVFAGSAGEQCEHDGYAALRFAIPDNLARVQRRQAYRVTVPANNPIPCTFLPPGTELRPLTEPATVDLLNISTGGIAIIDAGYMIDSRPGASYSACQIEFPGYPVLVALEVRHAQIMTLASGKVARQIGFRFVGTSIEVTALVQRYIMKLEREQNAKSLAVR